MHTNIAIFASGAGSNARKIIEYFPHPLPPLHGVERGHADFERDNSTKNNIKVSLVACNKVGAGVLDIARELNIPAILLDKEKFFRGNAYVDELKEAGINIIVLAGFLWKVPSALVNAYPGRIINIHPALLPKYGGKGMYGNFVHTAVIAAGEKESGITIHLVDELYDHGQHIFQATCPVLPGDTAESLASRIHSLEHANYPKVIAEFVKNLEEPMKDLILKFHAFIKEKIERYKNLYAFGEDSIRYDFYHAALNLFNLTPSDIILEQALPSSLFTAKERDITMRTKQGRSLEKPEFDLRIDPIKQLQSGLLAEFAFFRSTETAHHQAKSQRHGKLMNEMFRLALLKSYKNDNGEFIYKDFSKFRCLLICVTDSEMIDYGYNDRGPRAIPIQAKYELSEDYLKKFPKTITGSIDDKFLSKAKTLKIVPVATRIYEFNEPAKSITPKWATWVWEVSYNRIGI